MTTQDHETLRAVIVPAGLKPADSRAGKLLRDLGHDVAGAESASEALDLLRESETDLMVVDVSNSEENQSLVRQLAELPVADRPRALAIFSESFDQGLRDVRKRIGKSRVHVFIKPLHMHGLLSVLRQLETDSDLV